MNRRGTSVLLIPFLAALALFYPAARQSSPDRSRSSSASPDKTQAAAKPKSAAAAANSPGHDLVRDFLGLDQKVSFTSKPIENARTATVRFLIATVPDPVDSGLPYGFDRNLASMQAAFEREAYLPRGFQLPWQACLSGSARTVTGEKSSGSSDDDQRKACRHDRPFEREPGVVLLARNSTDPGLPPASLDLLLLYLIGEAPVTGIQKPAMRAALDEIAAFCQSAPVAKRTPQLVTVKQESCRTIDILGPTFSGSAVSLDLTLHSWLNSANSPETAVRMVSGSATGIEIPTDFHNLTELNRTGRLHDFSFHSMEAPDSIATCDFLHYLTWIEPNLQKQKIALLSESGTVYGAGLSPMCPDINVTRIPFPLHISQLRSASERIAETQQTASPQPATSQTGLPLAQSLGEVNPPRDIVPPFSPMDTVTSEQVMSQLLSTISREHYRYVGVMATDIRDTIFLAQELRQHCPTTILFAFGPDLLMLHPEVNPSLRGMLLVTSYPLRNANQLWSRPYWSNGRYQFGDQGAEGVYNATLALLDPSSSSDMLEYSLPFTTEKYAGQSTKTRVQDDGTVAIRAPLWITVIGRDRMWPVQVYDMGVRSSPAQSSTAGQNSGRINPDSVSLNELISAGPGYAGLQDYMYPLGVVHPWAVDDQVQESWWPGLISDGSRIFLAVFSVVCILFSLSILSHLPQQPLAAPPGGGSRLVQVVSLLQIDFLRNLFCEPATPAHRREGKLYLLAACACLLVFLSIALTALVVPLRVFYGLGAFKLQWQSHWQLTVVVTALCALAVLLLFIVSVSILIGLALDRKQTAISNGARMDWRSWSPFAVGITVVFASACYLTYRWICQASSIETFRMALFASLRSLDFVSGVSPLAPLFLISLAGFIWSVSSFCRVRQLDSFETRNGFLCFQGSALAEIGRLEELLRSRLQRASLRLSGSLGVLAVVLCSGAYIFASFVRSLESGPLYWLLGAIFLLVNLALWLGVLRFYSLWQQMSRMLRHLQWMVPLRAACKRFRDRFPDLPKLDLASPPPMLTPVVYSVDQARVLWIAARQLLGDQPQPASLKPNPPAASSPGNADASSAAHWSRREVSAFRHLGSFRVARYLLRAEHQLDSARLFDAEGDLRAAALCKLEAQEQLSEIASAVSKALEDCRGAAYGTSDPADGAPSRAQQVFNLAEEFLVGRIVNFFAYVFPQMQNLIITAVVGLLLMLVAVSSYPFQPHNLLLFFNWVVILMFVGIAMWVFTQMNRNQVLSSLNGTKPGQVTWDREFIFRIVIYGLVPILALLGAQFPQSVGQILSRIIPAEAGH